MRKICLTCNIEQSFSHFRTRTRKGRIYYESCCRLCEKENNKKRYQENINWYREYSQNNKNKIDVRNREYYQKNRNRLVEYRKARKEQDKENLKAYNRYRRKRDPAFKMRQYVSNSIYRILRKNSATKAGKSCLEYLNYTFEELKIHIENQFEPWMNWNNHGRYNNGIWNNNDSSTWAWQLDHIIPQSDMPYKSMDDENFLKCWDLANLRPLSAKENVIEGTRLIRHKQAF